MTTWDELARVTHTTDASGKAMTPQVCLVCPGCGNDRIPEVRRPVDCMRCNWSFPDAPPVVREEVPWSNPPPQWVYDLSLIHI